MTWVLSKTRRPDGQHRRRLRIERLLTVALAVALGASCVRPTQPPSRPPEPVRPPAPAEEPQEAPADVRRPTPPVPPETPLPEDDFASQSLEEINRTAQLQPVFFDYDSTDLDANASAAIEVNAVLLARYANWSVTVEGHCDSRGTPEYNLALGEQRALAVRSVLVNLGVEASRIQTISYGEEFPFAPGDTPEAWAQNRRAHFVITAR